MKQNTKITTVGRNPHANHGVVNPPVYHASTILFKDYEEYKASRQGGFIASSYGRYGTESTLSFAQALADLDGGYGGIVTASGVSAFTTTLFALLNAGDHLLMTDSVYDPTRKFCDAELARLGIETTYYDPMIGGDISELIRENTKVVFCESPGSLTFEVQDVPVIAKAAHAKGVKVVLDNTYAAPILNKPYELGVDAVIYSGSKYVSGHSDLIMGVITANEETYSVINKTHKNIGACPGPDDVYLAQRGLRTLGARMKQHESAALEIAHWLKGRSEVLKVLHPALPDCPGHEIFKRDFSGSNGLFGVILRECSERQVAAFFDSLHHFGMGYSWGGYESLIIPLWLDKIRSVNQYKEGRYIRLHIGLEDVDDLKADLEAGFTRMADVDASAA